MSAQIPSLPPGAGKYENTLKWVFETAPQSAQYPYVKRPKATFYIATRQEVERRDISRFLSIFGPQITEVTLRALQAKVLFTVQGYGDDPYELCEIPAVCEYYSAIYREWPAWLFFADLRAECLRMVAQCLLPSVAAANPSLRDQTDHLQAFFLLSLPTAAWCYKRAGLPRLDGATHMKSVARYLGLFE